MKKNFTLLFVILILLTACDSTTATPPTPPTTDSVTQSSPTLTDISLPTGYGVDGGWFQLYFTNPESPLASQKTGGIDGPLAEAIDAAKLSVDVAVYSLSLNSVRSPAVGS